jgi:O-acetyl-ADP-ribose deacetylase (regulator of RNase III)
MSRSPFQLRLCDHDELLGGELPVGAAVFVETGDHSIPFLIAAPTMVTPQPVPPAHSFFAMSAILRTASLHAGRVTTVCCPGLATGIGEVGPDDAAAEMAAAWRKWLRSRGAE